MRPKEPDLHLEEVMGTVVGFTSPESLPPDGLWRAVASLHEADRVFSTWSEASAISRLRRGSVALEDLAPAERQLVDEVFGRCRLARELTDGAFDPWAMPGGVDPTGLVKGWAAERALRQLQSSGVSSVMVNAGGDIAVLQEAGAPPWRVGLRHPSQPSALFAVVEVSGAVATSGNYERPGQLLDPLSGEAASGVLSATVIGPELDLADALATALAVAGQSLLGRIADLEGYEAHLVTAAGRHFATPGMPFAA